MAINEYPATGAVISRMNERITIQRSGTAIDRYQNHSNTWADHYSCYAHASTYGKDETGSKITTEERQVTFEVRYCSELKDISSTGYRVLFHGEVYDIEAVDMMDYQKRRIRLKCKRERARR